jgi:hypothetical protein
MRTTLRRLAASTVLGLAMLAGASQKAAAMDIEIWLCELTNLHFYPGGFVVEEWECTLIYAEWDV